MAIHRHLLAIPTILALICSLGCSGGGGGTAPQATTTGARIDFPKNDMVFHSGDTVAFSIDEKFTAANSVDAIVFYSNIDGELGSNPSFSTRTLSVGTHYITVRLYSNNIPIPVEPIQITVSDNQTATPYFIPSTDDSGTITSVSIETATSGSSIYYSTDGRPPEGNSLPYTGPIRIDNTARITTILARAYGPELEGSDIAGTIVNSSSDLVYEGVDGIIDPGYAGEDLGKERIVALRPLAASVLAQYGNPSRDLDRARALRDWVARTALHPHSPWWLHASETFSVFPAGLTWSDAADGQDDGLFTVYAGFVHDGVSMLEVLAGKFDPATQGFDNTGAMFQAAPGRFEIRTLSTYPYVYCSYQANILIALLNAVGLHSTLISTAEHDTCAVYIPEFGRWIYQDPTFNEEYLAVKDPSGDRIPLAPCDLFRASVTGALNTVAINKTTGPAWDNSVYPDPRIEREATYFIPGKERSMTLMGSRLNNAAVGEPAFDPRYVQIRSRDLYRKAPFNNAAVYRPVPEKIAFPDIGAGISRMVRVGDRYVVELFSTFPGHKSFMMNLDNKGWEERSTPDTLPANFSSVVYRSVDADGFHGMDATVRRVP